MSNTYFAGFFVFELSFAIISFSRHLPYMLQMSSSASLEQFSLSMNLLKPFSSMIQNHWMVHLLQCHGLCTTT